MWHLSIDDLLAPLGGRVRLGGAGPFVINLSASTAPISVPGHPIPEQPHIQVYQIQRVEDGRIRYRLRLGPFDDEETMDPILDRVRQDYPSALTATASADDLFVIENLRAKAEARQKPVRRPVANQDVAATVVPPAPAVVVEHDASTLLEIIDTTPEAAAVPAAAAAVASAAPVDAAPPDVEIPTLDVVVESPGPALQAAAPVVALEFTLVPDEPRIQLAMNEAVKPAFKPVPASKTPVLESLVRQAFMRASGSHPARVTQLPTAAPAKARAEAPTAVSQPTIESTHTVRPLTSLELSDREASRWFVIQLALADQAFDPDTVPHLDLFSAYRLYSVAGLDGESVRHALRLGFFGDETSARMVANYVGAYYENPTIKRISLAERDRFSDQVVEARKDVGATGKHAVIEITDELVVREGRQRR